jgi:hypothetical protein
LTNLKQNIIKLSDLKKIIDVFQNQIKILYMMAAAAAPKSGPTIGTQE